MAKIEKSKTCIVYLYGKEDSSFVHLLLNMSTFIKRSILDKVISC